jgi:hypothetical protein
MLLLQVYIKKAKRQPTNQKRKSENHITLVNLAQGKKPDQRRSVTLIGNIPMG